MQDEFIDHKLESELFSILSPELLNEIIIEEFPHVRLGPSVSQVLTTLTNGFLQDVVKNSYIISKHKSHSEIQADDILVYLKIKYPDTRLEEFCETISQRKEGKSGIGTLFNEENTISSNSGLLSVKLFNTERLKKERRISQRLKQINIAKNSVGYQRYTTAVKKNERKKELSLTWHPSTPDPYSNASKSCFSGRLREWKLRLHLWGNLDDLEYNNLIENNLKFPSGANLNQYSKINYIESILDNSNDNTNDSSFKLIKFSDLKISPISFSEKNLLTKAIKANRSRTICALNSLINSIKLSKKMVLPKIIDCKTNHDITNCVTLFIPDNYKGTLVWKSSNFIRHCDITFAANKHYLKILERGLSLSEFNKRYDINILWAAQNSDSYLKDIQINISNYEEYCNELCKLRGEAFKNTYALTNDREMISHRSNKVILTQNKLFGFREQDVFRMSFSYHPSAIIYCKILDKLNKINFEGTHFCNRT
ncbi:SLBP family of RNA binding [Cryptosporidium sp. chipmunk genotype I]|uniref:SLBP family of RNA binding n=1 Tax=Cryptosporidium sp. chipmunk genotype I TaxID=1280935 RepID=UPI00351A3C4B|nr:SLBP family of RNA binding [Cryptosporidium sp. chipmunk genotype I]